MIITASSNVPTVVAGAGGVFELGARLDATDISQLSTQYAITVNWVITGTAVPGVDYPVDSPPTSGTAHLSFPVGAGGIVIPFSTIAVPGHNSETMTLHIVSASTSPDTYCDIGPDATVTIQSLIGVHLSSPTGGDTTKAVVPVNSKDPDGDGVPAFAEGFTPHAAGASANAKADVPPFTPITLDVTGTADLSSTTLTFNYSALSPSGVKTSPGKAAGTLIYKPAAGLMRVWTKDGTIARKGSPLASGGDYVAPGVAYTPAQLGLSDSNRSITLYVEGINPSAAQNDGLLQVTLGGGGAGTTGDPKDPPKEDSVTVTTVKGDLEVTQQPRRNDRRERREGKGRHG